MQVARHALDKETVFFSWPASPAGFGDQGTLSRPDSRLRLASVAETESDRELHI